MTSNKNKSERGIFHLVNYSGELNHKLLLKVKLISNKNLVNMPANNSSMKPHLRPIINPHDSSHERYHWNFSYLFN